MVVGQTGQTVVVSSTGGGGMVTQNISSISLFSGLATTTVSKISQTANPFGTGFTNECFKIEADSGSPSSAYIKLYSTNELSFPGNVHVGMGDGFGQFRVMWTNGQVFTFMRTGWLDITGAQGIKGGVLSNTVIDASCPFPPLPYAPASVTNTINSNTTVIAILTNEIQSVSNLTSTAVQPAGTNTLQAQITTNAAAIAAKGGSFSPHVWTGTNITWSTSWILNAWAYTSTVNYCSLPARNSNFTEQIGIELFGTSNLTWNTANIYRAVLPTNNGTVMAYGAWNTNVWFVNSSRGTGQ